MKALQLPFVAIDELPLGFLIESEPLNVARIDMVGVQLKWEGTGAATVKVQVSADYVDAERPVTPTWSDYNANMSSITSPTGTSGSSAFLIATIPFLWFRLVSTPTTPAVAATLIVQDLTYTAVTAGTAGNSITIAYVDDGTAGAETVSVLGTAIKDFIENGLFGGREDRYIAGAIPGI